MKLKFLNHADRGAVALVVCVFLAQVQGAQALELSIKNELRADEAGSVLYIEDARSIESPKSRFTASIQPGKTVKITRGNLGSVMLVRPFSRHKLKYEITCTGREELHATVTLLEIHNNTLPEGCTLSRVGHWSKRTGLNWQEKPNKPQ